MARLYDKTFPDDRSLSVRMTAFMAFDQVTIRFSNKVAKRYPRGRFLLPFLCTPLSGKLIMRWSLSTGYGPVHKRSSCHSDDDT